MKTCKDCGVVKPLSEFYKHPDTADGHLNKCKTCKKSYQANHRVANIDQARAYDVERAKQPSRKRHSQEVTRRRREEVPGYTAAHNAVARALKAGALVKQPCERCGTTKQVQAHHDDYTKPLEVMWLCPVDHKVRHKELDALAA